MSEADAIWARCAFCGNADAVELLRAVMADGHKEQVCESCYRYDQHEELIHRIAELEADLAIEAGKAAGLVRSMLARLRREYRCDCGASHGPDPDEVVDEADAWLRASGHDAPESPAE